LRAPRVICVIDDDASIRAATDSLLRARGYVVHTFASAADFLGSPELFQASCVITDVRMPEITGVEMQTVIRRQGHRMPFIFVTAYPEEKSRLQAVQDGAICFLSKPFDAPTLLKWVEAALASAHALPFHPPP
jgi:FixJ family two-component response regulator